MSPTAWLTPCLQQLTQRFGRPREVLHDLSDAMYAACERTWSDVLHRVCHFHLLRDIGEDLFAKPQAALRERVRQLKLQPRLKEQRKGQADWLREHVEQPRVLLQVWRDGVSGVSAESLRREVLLAFHQWILHYARDEREAADIRRSLEALRDEFKQQMQAATQESSCGDYGIVVDHLERYWDHLFPAPGTLSIATQQRLHAARQIGLGCAEEQMEMVGHQGGREHFPTKALDGFANPPPKPGPVFVVVDDRSTTVASAGHVIGGSRILGTKFPRHGMFPSGSWRRGPLWPFAFRLSLKNITVSLLDPSPDPSPKCSRATMSALAYGTPLPDLRAKTHTDRHAHRGIRHGWPNKPLSNLPNLPITKSDPVLPQLGSPKY